MRDQLLVTSEPVVTSGMAEGTSKDPALSDRLAAAPRHGLNAKALLLQAAALAAQEAESLECGVPKAVSEREQQVAKLKSAFVGCSKLLTGIPKKESPIVAFVNTAKVLHWPCLWPTHGQLTCLMMLPC